MPGTRDEALPGETARVVARRGPTTIVRTHHGLTLAAAGIDASNVAPGSVVLLPVDPDGSARAIRARLHELTGRTVGVVVTDTAGRAWREGQTDHAVGAAGLRVLEDLAGRRDAYGNELVVTAPAVADELAGAAELVQGQARRSSLRGGPRSRRPRAAGRRRRPGCGGSGAAGGCRPVRLRRARGRAARPRGRPRRRDYRSALRRPRPSWPPRWVSSAAYLTSRATAWSSTATSPTTRSGHSRSRTAG